VTLIPVGAVVEILNSPESYVGWNSIPKKGVRAKLIAKVKIETLIIFLGFLIAKCITSAYDERKDWNPLSKTSKHFCKYLLRGFVFPPTSKGFFSQYAESMGVNE